MSVSTELIALQQDVTNARTAIASMGGQITAGGGSSQLAADIATIPQGVDPPTGIISITANGTYSVAEYASAVVDVAVPQNYGLITYDGTHLVVS